MGEAQRLTCRRLELEPRVRVRAEGRPPTCHPEKHPPTRHSKKHSDESLSRVLPREIGGERIQPSGDPGCTPPGKSKTGANAISPDIPPPEYAH